MLEPSKLYSLPDAHLFADVLANAQTRAREVEVDSAILPVERRYDDSGAPPRFLDRFFIQGGQPVSHPFVGGLLRAPRQLLGGTWTLTSRAQLFSGRLVAQPGEDTLIDDFSDRGYTVAYFSGQDDSYGDSVALVGADRADVFYDARSDKAHRTSRSMASVSLQVSWKTLTGRVLEYLDQVDVRRPLFLYVNIVDTHYPYRHDDLDPLLGVAPLDRSEIRSDQASRVRETYMNAAANVDAAIERVVEAFRARIRGEDHAILVTADHGESFYENDLLGHGQSLDGLQTRVPFILWGAGGGWPVPIAPTDVRGLLRRNLGLERGGRVPRARFVPDPERRSARAGTRAPPS